MSLPENLIALHEHEEELYRQSIELIEGTPRQGEELEMIHAGADLIIAMTRGHVHKTDDELTVQQLGLRMLNAATASLKLALSGYYQIAFHVARDLLETTNLLDLFLTEPERVSAWRTADENILKKQYQPIHVRQALEKHNDKAGQRRDHAYRIFSTYASHASNAGFKLVSPDGQTQMGPFLSPSLLQAFLEELAMRLSHGSLIFSMHFPDVEDPLLEARATFLSAADKWRTGRLPRRATP